MVLWAGLYVALALGAGLRAFRSRSLERSHGRPSLPRERLLCDLRCGRVPV